MEWEGPVTAWERIPGTFQATDNALHLDLDMGHTSDAPATIHQTTP